MSNIRLHWTPEDGAPGRARPLTGLHTLHTRDQFSDEGLADLLDRYPRQALTAYTMEDTTSGRGWFRKGRPGRLSGAELLEAVKRGRLWLNLRATNEHLPDYADLAKDVFGELEDQTPGVKTIKRDLGVLISSPNAQVFYHLDVPMTALWQVRGEKTLHVYPTGAPFAADEEIEAIVLGEREEEIAYERRFDIYARKIDLTPGRVATWPQTAPHRIVNGASLNVSLSTEFMTWPALVHANALYANGVLRRRFGLDPDIRRHGPAAKLAKAALARGLKAFSSHKSDERITPLSFRIDPEADHGVRNLAAA